MSVEVQADAEVRKLARTIGVDAERLAMLSDLPVADLRALRRQVGETLFRAGKHYFTRVAALSRAVPSAVAAKMTVLTLPPLIAARTAELLDPGKAADLVGRLPARYLADVSVAMDAARAPKVIAAIPPEQVAKVATELARRGEWIVIGGFVSVVTAEALEASVAAYDGEQLLRISPVLDDLSRLDEIAARLTERQGDQMIAGAAEHGLWDELAELLEHLSAEQVQRLSDRFAAAPADVRKSYRDAAKTGELDTAAYARLRGA